MKHFLLFFFCSYLTVVLGQEPSLTCVYDYDFEQRSYGCQLIINNPDGWNNFTDIGGIHLEGYTNSDVTTIYRFNGSTPNIPQIICDTFSNIIEYDFEFVGLTEVDDAAFSGCSSIERLYLNYNNISSISENAFVGLPDIQHLSLYSNRLTSLPRNVFESQRNLTELDLSYNSFDELPADIFRNLENLQYLAIRNCDLTAINIQWPLNSRLSSLNLHNNRITLSPSNFVGLNELRYLSLANNSINEIPLGAFAGLPSLVSLELYSNNFTILPADAFPDLGHLDILDLTNNPIVEINNDAFRGLHSLTTLYIIDCRIRELDTNSFQYLANLTFISLNYNPIEELPAGIFAPMLNLRYVGLYRNRIKTVRRNVFGTLTELRTLDLESNVVNAIDRAIIDDAVNLNTLYFSGNLCANDYFGEFLLSRDQHLRTLGTCFSNMRYIIDITTEGDDDYSFFDGPHPGIALRVRSDSEVQISLTPFAFLWTPMIEIFLGSSNNTRSVIRIDDDTDAATVPTPNIIQQNQWNDFRVTWANQVILVFSGNATLPFMAYTMQSFFNVNFYGLRAIETRATWSVQPFA